MFVHPHVMQTFQSVLGWVVMLEWVVMLGWMVMLGWVVMSGQPQAVLVSPMEKEAATGVQRGV